MIGRRAVPAVALAVALCLPGTGSSASEIEWRPTTPRTGDVVAVEIREPGPGTVLTGTLGQTPLLFSTHVDRRVAVVGLDLDTTAGPRPWQIQIQRPGQIPEILAGHLAVLARTFDVQRLTLPKGMVELDPATERRALAEGERLRALYRTTTPERLWRGRFIRPVATAEPGSGFGSRRIINGLSRAPHSGVDYAAPMGTAVLAANSGRVALVAQYFFPGRLAIVDHGLGLYTLYFHLESVAVQEGQMVEKGGLIGAVGASGRATGPHLHFGAQIGEARVDPEVLLTLDFPG